MIMKEVFLTHYYYGDRLTTFKTGLGTVIRTKGHSMNVKTVIVNDSFHWLENQNQFEAFNPILLDVNKNKEILVVLRELVGSLEETVFLIANFDLIIEKGIISLENFIDLLKEKNESTEILLTGEIDYPELRTIADYVSCIQSVEN